MFGCFLLNLIWDKGSANIGAFNDLDNAKLLNPIDINDNSWVITDTKEFDNDNLVIARKKELCFQE